MTIYAQIFFFHKLDTFSFNDGLSNNSCVCDLCTCFKSGAAILWHLICLFLTSTWVFWETFQAKGQTWVCIQLDCSVEGWRNHLYVLLEHLNVVNAYHKSKKQQVCVVASKLIFFILNATIETLCVSSALPLFHTEAAKLISPFIFWHLNLDGKLIFWGRGRTWITGQLALAARAWCPRPSLHPSLHQVPPTDHSPSCPPLSVWGGGWGLRAKRDLWLLQHESKLFLFLYNWAHTHPHFPTTPLSVTPRWSAAW